MADKSKVLEVAKKRYKRTVDATSDSRINQLDDRKFVAASPDNKWQWDNLALATRTTDGSSSARPALTVNLMPQHVYQVTNDQKQNRPAGKVLPVDDKADPKTAEVFNGIIRHIEVSSNVDIALDSACKSQVEEGEGFFRIVAEYADTDSFDQELKFKRIKDPFSVKMDPDIQDPTGADAKFCFIETPMLKEEFEDAFPDAEAVSWSPDNRPADLNAWFNDGKLIVAEYYRVEQEEQPVCMWPDGQTTTGADAKKLYTDQGIEPTKERKAKVPIVKWCRTNGFQILGEEKIVPGDCIPVFRVVGNEWFVEGKTVVSGIVRNAKDPQRMVNYWWSQEAELLALAPKAPFVGASGQFEGFESKWRAANSVNYPFLEYNMVIEDGIMAPPPQRMPPPLPPSGIIEAKVQALDAVKQTTGQYDASLGARSNETSGKAIMARQREGDVGTFHYGANLALAVRAYCKYLVNVIPVYYDRKRVARIIGEDGEPSHAQIDPGLVGEDGKPASYAKRQSEDGAIEEIYNPCVGKYDVVASTGPSYTTKRQEAAEFMATVLQGNKELMSVIGDLYFRMLDVPGVDDIADRLKRAVPPQLLGDENGEQQDPKVEQMGQVIQQLTQELHGAIDALQNTETKIKEYDAETKRISALAKYLTPDVVAQIVGGSLLTSTDLDQINDRLHPQHEIIQGQAMQAQQQMQPQGVTQ